VGIVESRWEMCLPRSREGILRGQVDGITRWAQVWQEGV
jgi:hypothetical protein